MATLLGAPRADLLGDQAMYLNFNDAAAFCCLSRARIEQLIRDPKVRFPAPYQPQGAGARRCFKQTELVAWIERKRAKAAARTQRKAGA